MNLREHEGAVTFDVLVQPRASRAKVGPVHDGRLKVAVTSPPVDGEANAAVIELLAKTFGVAKGAVSVIAGATSRRKTVRVAGITRAALVLLGLAACSGDVGVITVDLATAPGSTLLDDVQTLRLVVTDPHKVVTAQRSGDGFDLGFGLPADGTSGAIVVDGLDANGDVIASGATPRFAFGGVDGHVVVYMAAPNSVAVAPRALEPARSAVAAAPLVYGAVFAGGALASGEASDAIAIYNAYDHSLISGLPLPAPRAGLAIGVGTLGIYMFGGRADGGAPSQSLWRFDPQQPPSGIYLDYGDKPGVGRADEQFVPTGNEHFLLTGTPGVELSGLDGSMVAHSEVPSLPREGVTVTANDGTASSFFVGADGVVRCRQGVCEMSALPGRADARAVSLPGGKLGIVCGSTDLLRIDAATLASEPFAGIPTVARTGCAVAVTSRHLVIAGGTTAAGIDGTVEIYDAATLAPVATTTLAVPRRDAVAITLANDQVLIAGGLDASGQPTATLELFTPANP
jgi:uncharacterized protein